jgi:hypothetical protein
MERRGCGTFQSTRTYRLTSAYRSATTLDGSMELRVLNFDEWMAGKRELEAMRTTRKSPK